MNSLYHYLFGLEDYQEQIIEKQKRHRHLLHEQIRKTDNIQKILKPRVPLNIPSNIPVPYKKKKKI